MPDANDRERILKAIKKCLADGKVFFQRAMDELDEIGKGSIGVGLTPLVGGYAIQDPKSKYRTALIELDSAERALQPLIIRFNDGRVNKSHFKNESALIILQDLAGVDYDIFVRKLADHQGRESTWFRLKELKAKIDELQSLVEDA